MVATRNSDDTMLLARVVQRVHHVSPGASLVGETNAISTTRGPGDRGETTTPGKWPMGRSYILTLDKMAAPPQTVLATLFAPWRKEGGMFGLGR